MSSTAFPRGPVQVALDTAQDLLTLIQTSPWAKLGAPWEPLGYRAQQPEMRVLDFPGLPTPLSPREPLLLM